jgi:uncharacterized protein YwgA
MIECLNKAGSWCGETHVQKTIYLLKELFLVPLDFKYILYKHGPYSFDLNDKLTSLWADSIIDYHVSIDSYGPNIVLDEKSKQIFEKAPKTIEVYSKYVEFIAKSIGKSNVRQLEKTATALYTITNYVDLTSDEERAEQINKLKPHISVEDSYEAIREVKEMMENAEKIKASPIS